MEFSIKGVIPITVKTPILAPIIEAKTLFKGVKTLFKIVKWHLTPYFLQLPLQLV